MPQTIENFIAFCFFALITTLDDNDYDRLILYSREFFFVSLQFLFYFWSSQKSKAHAGM